MPDITLGEYLVAWRARMTKQLGRKFTQAEAAERLSANAFGWPGPTRRTIQRWEDGKPCAYPALVLLACREVEATMNGDGQDGR